MISPPARGPWTCPDRRVLDRRGGEAEGVCVYPGYTHGGGTRMDTEGVHARPSRGRHRVAGYALGGGFRAGSNDC